MAGSAVRELITKIKFLTDGSGVELAKKKVADLKAKMSQVSRQKVKVDVDTSKIDAAKKKLETVGGNLMSGGATLSAAGAGLLGGIALPVKTAADFEATMSKVRAITGSTDEQMQRLTDTARQLGRDTVFSASEAGQAMTYLGMAGWKTDQIIAGMPGLLDLAAASGGDLARTADIISDDLTAFGMKAEEAGHMADVFAAASMNANTNTELMGYTFKYVGAVCGAMKYSIEDAALATGMLANAGIKGEMAGTQLRAIIANLASPTNEAAKALEKLEVKITDENEQMKPLRQVMNELRQAMSGLSEEQKAQVAQSIAGKEAMTGLLTIVNTSQTDMDKLAAAIDNADGAAHSFAETSKNNLWGRLKELKSAAEEMAIELGNSLLPAFSGITEFVRGATNAISGFIKEHPKLAGGIMATAAALGALLTIGGGLGVLIGGLMQIGAVFASIASAVAGSGIVAMLGGLAPLAAILAAAFALIGAMIKFCTDNWGTFMAWVQPGLDSLSEGVKYFQDAWAALAPVVEALSPVFMDIIDLVGGLLVKHFTNLFRIGAWVFSKLGQFASWLAEKIAALIGPISTVANGISGLIGKAKEFLGFDASIDAKASSVNDAAAGAGAETSNTVNQTNTFNVNSPEEAAAAANGLAVPEFDG